MISTSQTDPTALPAKARARQWPVLLTVAVGILLSLITAALVRTWEVERVEREFRWRAESRARSFENILRGYEETLFAVRDVFHAAHSVSANVFRETAIAQLERHPGLVTIEWLPLIQHAQRAPTERAVQEVQPSWFIRDRAGVSAPSGPRAEYLPVLYCEPLAGREATLGTDQFLGNYQRAIQRAMDTGLPSATRRVPMEGETDEPFGVSILIPVHLPVQDPTRGRTREDIRGFVRGVFSLRDLALRSALTAEAQPIDLLLADHTPAGREPYLFHLVGARFGAAPPPGVEDFRSGMHADFRISCGGREWVLHTRPAAAWLAQRRTLYPVAFFTGGFLLTLLLASRQHQRKRRAEEIERLVHTRTEQLRRAEVQLREDVQRRLAAEQARAENEVRLRLAMEAALVATWEWDKRTGTFTLSDQLCGILGITTAESTGRFERYAGLIHPDDRELVEDLLDHSLVAGVEFECEFRIVRPDGSLRWLVTRGDVRRGANGETLGMIGAALDVTARKVAADERARIEQRLQDAQKLESLGVLAGGIAHDFNNLLTGILGNASLARMDLSPSSPTQQSLAQIEQASQRAAELCKQMLAYSGKGRFVVQAVDLSQLVEEAAPLLQVSVSKGAVVKYRLARGLPAVNGDVTQLRQILMNLVINASDAFGGRGGVIEVETGVVYADAEYLAGAHLSPALPGGDYVFLKVSDNGCGMDAETQKRIFDPFFTTKFTGRGLGLAAVLGIVRGHQGALKVHSELGRGSTFKLLLPAIDGPAEALPGAVDSAGAWRGSGTVLVVDDEATVREVATRMLEAFGFEPVVVASGREAVEVFRKRGGNFVAVLLDLTMPHMDGAETFAELRRLRPSAKVLLMSGFNEQEAVNRFAGKGLAGFLQKPFKPEALREKLRVMLG